MPGALQHLLVLDLTSHLSGPYCAMMLADHGAEFEFQQFEDFLGRIVVRGIGHGRRRNGGIRRSRRRFGSSEQAKRHRFSRYEGIRPRHPRIAG